MMSSAWRTESSGAIVTGSTIMPLSERFTRSTSSAWRSMVMLRWMKPMPPWRAMAMARRASVTVSMAAATMGMLSEILRERQVRVSACVGSIDDFPGQQQHVVESQRFGDGSFNHLFSYESEGPHMQQSPASMSWARGRFTCSGRPSLLKHSFYVHRQMKSSCGGWRKGRYCAGCEFRIRI